MVFCECPCVCRTTHVCVCVHACVRERERERPCVCSRLWCWASCSDPTECTILSENKGPAVPPHLNRGLLRQRRPYAAEQTKYFPSCSEFVSINSFVFWGFLSPLARCLWWKTLEHTGGRVISESCVKPRFKPGRNELFTVCLCVTSWHLYKGRKNHAAVQQEYSLGVIDIWLIGLIPVHLSPGAEV